MNHNLSNTESRTGCLRNRCTPETDGNGGRTAGKASEGEWASGSNETNNAKPHSQGSDSRTPGTNCEGAHQKEEGTRETQGNTKPKCNFTYVNCNGRWWSTPHGKLAKLKLIEEEMRSQESSLAFITESHLKKRETTLMENSIIYRSDREDGRAGILVMTRDERWKVKNDTELIEGYAASLTLESREGDQLKIMLIYGNNRLGNTSLKETYETLSRNTIDDYDMVLGDFNVSERNLPEKAFDSTYQRLQGKIRNWTRNLVEVEHDSFTFERRDGKAKSNIDRIFHKKGSQIKGSWTFIPWSDHRIWNGSFTLADSKRGRGPKRLRPINTKSREWIKHATNFIEKMKDVSEIPDDKRKQEEWIKIKRWALDNAPENEKKWTRERIDLEDLKKSIKSQEEREVLDEELRQKNRSRRPLEPLRDCEESINRTILEEEKYKSHVLTADHMMKKKEKAYFKWNERPTKNFFQKKKGSRIQMTSLKDEGGLRHHDTKGMGKVATNFYKKLHTSDKIKNREAESEKFLKGLNIRKDEKFKEGDLNKGEIGHSLKKSKRGKVPGPDGLPFEWWKLVTSLTTPTSDPVGYLTNILNSFLQDIKTPKFTEAYLTLLHKKGDTENMKNYRPISLLNTDYKLLTLCLNERLMEHAKRNINEDQIGFIRGRHILEHLSLSQTLDGLNDKNIPGGTVLALDNEKAYDRVERDFMIRTLKHFGIPEYFTNCISNLYKTARTHVWINGHKTGSFRLGRGVRQGDPLSCLLFNYTIETLAIKVRSTQRLTGIPLGKGEKNNKKKNLKIKLFADDTQIFLSEGEKVNTFLEVTEGYRTLSGAKYNVEKSEAFTVNNGKRDSESEIRYSEKQVRVLGAYVNDGSRARNKWLEIHKKLKQICAEWSKKGLTIKGRAIIAKALLHSRTLYLALSSDIPPDILRKIDSTIRTFTWGHKNWFPVEWNRLRAEKEKGGIDIFTLKERQTAGRISALQRLLANKEDWTTLAWTTIRNNTGLSENKNNPARGLNPLLQKGHTFLNSIPPYLKRIFQTAYELKIDSNPSMLKKREKENWPLFYHPGLPREDFKNPGCLSGSHRIGTLNYENTHLRSCERTKAHKTRIRKWKKTIKGTLWDPIGDPQSLIIVNDKQVKINMNRTRWEVFSLSPDRPITALSRKRDETRGWIRKAKLKIREKGRAEKIPLVLYDHEHATIFTDGSAKNNGMENVSLGMGIWVEEPRLGSSWKLELPKRGDNNSAEIVAIGLAIETIKARRLTINTDSKVALGLIENLPELEKSGYTGPGKKYEVELRYIMDVLRQQGKTVTLNWIKGHSGNEGNEEADKLAENGHTSGDILILEKDRKAGLLLGTHKLKTITKWLQDYKTKEMEITWELEKMNKWTRKYWGIEISKERLAKRIWNMGQTPKEKEFAWKATWGLLEQDRDPNIRCPWCRSEDGSWKHTLLKCGPFGLQEMWKEGGPPDIEDSSSWNAWQILEDLSQERNKNPLEQRRTTQKIVLLGHITNYELENARRTGKRLPWHLLPKLKIALERQKRQWAREDEENKKKKEKEKENSGGKKKKKNRRSPPDTEDKDWEEQRNRIEVLNLED